MLRPIPLDQPASTCSLIIRLAVLSTETVRGHGVSSQAKTMVGATASGLFSGLVQ